MYIHCTLWRVRWHRVAGYRERTRGPICHHRGVGVLGGGRGNAHGDLSEMNTCNSSIF